LTKKTQLSPPASSYHARRQPHCWRGKGINNKKTSERREKKGILADRKDFKGVS